jgi:adenylate cyclase
MANAKFNDAQGGDIRATLRVGLSLGEVVVADDTVTGAGIVLAQRLEQLAATGGVVIQGAVFEAVPTRFPFSYKSLGEHRLKGFDQPVRAFAVTLMSGETVPPPEEGAASLSDSAGPAVAEEKGSAAAERRLAAIVIADVVGYAKLIQVDEEGTRALLRRLQEKVIKPRIEAEGGRLIKTTGDAYLLEFPSAEAAVRCAVEMQTALVEAQSELPGETRILLRVGVNVGDVIVEGAEIHGDAVNVTERLQRLSDPGGVCISRSVHEQIKNKSDFEYQYLGEHEVNDLRERIHAYRVLNDERAPSTTFELMDESGETLVPTRPSIVIPPFAKPGDAPETASLADGLRIDILNALTRVSGVFVIAIASANTYRGKSPREAATAFAVQYALDGNVRQAGGKIRVSVTLTDTLSGETVWAEQYDRDLEDTFTVFDEIAAHVLLALNVKLVMGEPAKIWHKTLKDFRSLALLYQGIDTFYGMTEDAMELARAKFERVADWNPDVSAGPTWMAITHWIDFQRDWNAPREMSLKKARQWAEKGTALAGCDGQAYTILMHLHLVEHDIESALNLGREAISVRPNCTAAHSHYANVLHYCGHQEEALHNIQLAMRFSPMQQPIYLEILAKIYRALGRYEEAVETARRAIAANPNSMLSYLVLASLAVVGNDREAQTRLKERVLGLESSFSLTKFAEGQPYGDGDFLAEWLSELRAADLPE